MARTRDDDRQLLKLEARIDKLQTQKDYLLKEVGLLEEKIEKSARLYRKYLPPLLDTLGESSPQLASHVRNLSQEFKKKASLSRIELIFKEIREVILKKEMAAPGGSGKSSSSLFGGLFKSSSPSFIKEFKVGYQDIVNSLKERLSKEHLSRLTEISNRISAASQPEEFNAIRRDLFEMIRSHMVEIEADRARIASFVQDIVKKIIEIESMVVQSYDHTNDAVKSSEEFDDFLIQEIGTMKGEVDVADSLDLLKTRVTTTLTSIEASLKKKSVKEKVIKELAAQNKAAFKTGFIQLKRELDRANEQSRALEIKLNQDPLTGAFNRRAYNVRVKEEMARFLRYGSVFSLLMMDVDHFKKVNDTYGHAVGDRCLQEIIRKTAPHLRQCDMLARYGGEEFVVIMPETDSRGALVVAEKIRQTIEKIEFLYKNDTVRLTISIGVTQVREGDDSFDKVFNRADAAVYKAKAQGRNRVVLK